MHSRPFTSPSKRENGPSTRVSARNYGGISIPNDEAVPLVSSDLDTNQLLPRRPRPLRVRIQGRLAIVRTVSVANLRPARTTAQADTSREYMRGLPTRRRGSNAGSEVEDEDGDDGGDDDDGVAEGDAQFRGYGIGGAGNIRRPTEVMGAPSSASTSLSSLGHTSPHSPAISLLDGTKSAKLRLRMTGLLKNLRGYNRSRGSAGDL